MWEPDGRHWCRGRREMGLTARRQPITGRRDHRLDANTMSVEVCFGSSRHKVPVKERDEHSPIHHDDEGWTGHSGSWPGLFHEDVPNRLGSLAQRFTQTSASS